MQFYCVEDKFYPFLFQAKSAAKDIAKDTGCTVVIAVGNIGNGKPEFCRLLNGEVELEEVTRVRPSRSRAKRPAMSTVEKMLRGS